MTFPNSQFDPEIVQWGWPWHGRIETPTFGASNGTLRLSSGATMTVKNAGWPSTYLWDIGMPEPVNDSENPDEQWLNKAIIRSDNSGGPVPVAFWYGGAGGSSLYPMYIPGRGVLRRLFSFQFTDITGEVTIRLQAIGFTTVTQVFSLSAVGLNITDAISPVSGVIASVTDCSPDGRKMLMLLVPYRQSTFGGTPVELFGRSVIELTAGVTEAGALTLGMELISSYGDKVASYENGFASLADELAATRGLWVDSVNGETYEGWLSDTLPPAPAGVWQLISRWPIGSNFSRTIYSTPIWAWYDAAGAPELVSYRVTSLLECSHSGTYTSRSGFSRQTLTYEVFAGSSTSQLAYISNSNLSGDQSGTDVTGTITADGELLSSSGVTRTTPIDRFSVGYLSEEAAELTADAQPWGYIRLSNKLICPYLRALRRSSAPAGVTEDWAGPALNPGGIDSGRYERVSDWPEADRNRWASGSYNPITGQVVRHLRDLYCSWV